MERLECENNLLRQKTEGMFESVVREADTPSRYAECLLEAQEAPFVCTSDKFYAEILSVVWQGEV